ncbi:MAG TPA: response regulator [Ktedonobacteraceae bacterium]|nr:response regulator [Ktedonobacteraceae bacterium]
MPEEHAPALQQKTILVVEDDEGIGSFLVQAILQETPYEAELATDGFEAVQIYTELHPDLLILDYQLPGMNGIELYDRLLDKFRLAAIPAIMISARLPTKDIAKRKLASMRKPFELEDLFDMLDKMLD